MKGVNIIKATSRAEESIRATSYRIFKYIRAAVHDSARARVYTFECVEYVPQKSP